MSCKDALWAVAANTIDRKDNSCRNCGNPDEYDEKSGQIKPVIMGAWGKTHHPFCFMIKVERALAKIGIETIEEGWKVDEV